MPSTLSVEELAALGPEEALIVQVTKREVYEAAHVPGAVHVAPGDLVCGEPPATGRLPSIGALTDVLRRIGYHHDTDVVVLDDEGGGWAGRFAWTLDVVGNDRWRYLDGGLHAWHAAGLPLSSDEPPVQPSSVEISLDRRFVAEAEDIMASLYDPDFVVWDCRSREEYEGSRVSAARGGHIPGAVHLDWLELMDHQRNLCLVAGLEDLLRERGITPAKDVVTHCQTHHRSGLTYMVARLLGFERIRAYHGSWSEWGNRADTPVAVGP